MVSRPRFEPGTPKYKKICVLVTLLRKSIHDLTSTPSHENGSQ